MLGINLSILGLVELSGGSLPLLGMTYALVLVLDLVFVAVFLVLERRVFFGAEVAVDSQEAVLITPSEGSLR